MAHKLHEGKALSFNQNKVTPNGALVVIGQMVGVAVTAAKPNETFGVDLTGCYNVPLKSGESVTVGDALYVDPDTLTQPTPGVTKTAPKTNAILAGYAFRSTSTGSNLKVMLRLLG